MEVTIKRVWEFHYTIVKLEIKGKDPIYQARNGDQYLMTGKTRRQFETITGWIEFFKQQHSIYARYMMQPTYIITDPTGRVYRIPEGET